MSIHEAPSLSEQETFWNSWNSQWRKSDTPDEFMALQAATAERWIGRVGESGLRILDVGCGTGWLGASLTRFGKVVGTDLSDQAIQLGRTRFPELDLRTGDFLELDLPKPFDFIVSADVIAHVYDQRAFMARIVELLRPGGIFLLMTQNAFVWHRSSYLAPQGKGQIRNWPRLSELRQLFAERFEILGVSSLMPGGDRGVLRLVQNRYLRFAAGLAIGKERWQRVRERMLTGRELVIAARLNP